MRRRRLRNPRHGGGALSLRGVVRNAIVPGAIGAGGALALDVAMGYLKPMLPPTLQTGWINTGVKVAGAIALGMVAGRFLGRERGRIVTLGALTVVSYGVLKEMLASAGLPGLAGYADYTPYRMGAYMGAGTAVLPPRRLGYISPAPVIGGGAMSPRMGAYMNVAPGLGDYGDGM